MEPGQDQPRVGVDEWVAEVERRRLRRTGLVGMADRVWRAAPRPAWMGLAIAGAVLFGMTAGSDFHLRVGTNALLAALLVLGLNVVVGWAGLLDLGYVAFYGFGAYAYALLASPKLDIQLPTIAVVPVVVVGCSLLGLLLGLPSRRLLGDYLAIVTLFFAQIFLVLTTNGNRIDLPGTGVLDITGGPNGIPGVDPFAFAGIEAIEIRTYYWIALAAFVLVVTGLYFLAGSRTGRAWRALREDPLAAEAMTIPVNRLKLLAFAFGAGTAGLTGTIFAAVQIGVFPQNFELFLLITIYAMLILGGAGSLGGAVIGAVTITVVLEILRDPDDARLVFYVAIAIALATAVRPWARLVALVAATALFGFVVRWIAEAAWPRGVARAAEEDAPLLARALDSWVLLPSDPGTITDVAFVAVVLGVLGLTLARGWQRLTLLVPVLYLTSFVWENKLVFQPSVTRFLLVGALLVVMMNVRPQGLMGTARVEIA
jgi:branched-chain amino acid transport system permease protein